MKYLKCMMSLRKERVHIFMEQSKEILLKNLKRYCKCESNRVVAKKLGLSLNVIKNWSSGRSSPSIRQIDEIAFIMNVEVSQLLIPDNLFTLDTPLWKEGALKIFSVNLGKLKNEKGITEKNFDKIYNNVSDINYRRFLDYIRGDVKRLNLKKLDQLSRMLSVEPHKLLER